jgi:hypothetical protein
MHLLDVLLSCRLKLGDGYVVMSFNCLIVHMKCLCWLSDSVGLDLLVQVDLADVLDMYYEDDVTCPGKVLLTDVDLKVPHHSWSKVLL